jgi:hypothetical protein
MLQPQRTRPPPRSSPHPTSTTPHAHKQANKSASSRACVCAARADLGNEVVCVICIEVGEAVDELSAADLAVFVEVETVEELLGLCIQRLRLVVGRLEGIENGSLLPQLVHLLPFHSLYTSQHTFYTSHPPYLIQAHGLRPAVTSSPSTPLTILTILCGFYTSHHSLLTACPTHTIRYTIHYTSNHSLSTQQRQTS